MIDCAYKTNRFGMSLLHVVGLNSVYNSFSVCFVFLHKGRHWIIQMSSRACCGFVLAHKTTCRDSRHSINYDHNRLRNDTLAAIDSVFPQTNKLICRWHIAKNLLKNCSMQYAADDWDEHIKYWIGVGSCSFVSNFACVLMILSTCRWCVWTQKRKKLKQEVICKRYIPRRRGYLTTLNPVNPINNALFNRINELIFEIW